MLDPSWKDDQVKENNCSHAAEANSATIPEDSLCNSAISVLVLQQFHNSFADKMIMMQSSLGTTALFVFAVAVLEITFWDADASELVESTGRGETGLEEGAEFLAVLFSGEYGQDEEGEKV